jgi:transposase
MASPVYPVYPVYPSDLNDDEWALLSPLIPAAKPGGRPRSGAMRRILSRIMNGIFSVLRTGGAWRYLVAICRGSMARGQRSTTISVVGAAMARGDLGVRPRPLA